jgi:adenylosuccinate synthase
MKALRCFDCSGLVKVIQIGGRGFRRYYTMLNGPTDIALTFLDYLDRANREAFRFDQLKIGTVRFIEEVERVSGVPVSLISTNFGWRNVIDRRY